MCVYPWDYKKKNKLIDGLNQDGQGIGEGLLEGLQGEIPNIKVFLKGSMET